MELQPATPESIRYSCGAIDPRPTPEARAANESIFANPNGVLGIEVTIPEYASRCSLGNIDPQHTDGDAETAAIEVAATIDLPSTDASLVTVRPDLDSLGAMAVIRHRAASGEVTPEMSARIGQIAVSDKLSRGAWPGPKPLPTRENPWAGESAESAALRGVAGVPFDFKVPLETRVEMLQTFLAEGAEPAGYRERAEAERREVVEAIERGEIEVETRADGRVAFVETMHRAGTMVGYSQAPVVVALNPAFRQGPGEPHAKYTVCQYDDSHVDLAAVRKELAALEPGWGGSPTIIGSPQGQGSMLSKKVVLETVARHLKDREVAPLTVEDIRARVDGLIAEWQEKLPEVEIALGGSLVSGLFVLDDETEVVDVDVRFLTDAPLTEDLRQKIESATGLAYRKTITVSDWPTGESEGVMIEGKLALPGFPLPLDVEGCLRNARYVGWGKFYREVLSPEELADFFARKKALRHDKAAYKALKQEALALVKRRCVERGLVAAPTAE